MRIEGGEMLRDERIEMSSVEAEEVKEVATEAQIEVAIEAEAVIRKDEKTVDIMGHENEKRKLKVLKLINDSLLVPILYRA